MEETTREREERLKGWSTFLEKGNQEPQKNATNQPTESSTITEPSESSSAAEPEPQPQTEPQTSEEHEQEVDSTDSSLAGSDNEDA